MDGREDEKGQKTVDMRPFLALERTFLAWIRTAISMVAIGFVVAKFGIFIFGRTPSHLRPHSAVLGTVLAGSGGLLMVFAAIRHLRLYRRLQRGDARISPVWDILLAAWLTFFALLLTIYLIVVSPRG